MSLANPFCVGQNKKLEGNRIHAGFGSLNNFFVSQGPDTAFATGRPFPYDGYSLRSHISLIFLFTSPAQITKIVASTFRAQIGAGGGAERTTGHTRMFGRIIGLHNLGSNQEMLRRTIFDPLQWDKDDPVIKANDVNLTGNDYEAAAAWDGNPTGRVFRWANAELFFDDMIVRDDNFSWDVNISVVENDILIMTPFYQDRQYYDTTAALPSNVFSYAGGGAPVGGGTDYRTTPVLRTITISGENC